MESKQEQEEMSPNLDDYALKEWTETKSVKQECNFVCKEEIKVEPTKELNQEGNDSGLTVFHGKQVVDYANGEEYQINNCPSKKEKYKKGRKYKDIHPLTQNRNKTDMMINKLTLGASVSEEMSSLCLFKCSICDEPLKSWKALEYHLIHKHRVRTLSLLEISTYISKVVCYKCKICSDKLLCDTHFIKRHLTVRHGMQVNQYKDKYKYNMKSSPVIYSENVIGDLCVFKCKQCSKTFNSRSHLFNHTRNKNHMNKKFTNKDSLIKNVRHICHICKVSLSCNKLAIKAHTRKCHKVSLEEYCKISGCTMAKNRTIPQVYLETLMLRKDLDNSCIYECNICLKKYRVSSGFRQHYRTAHKQGLQVTLQSYIVKGFSYKCQKCSKLLLCDIEIVQKHMIRAHGEEKRYNYLSKDSKRIEYDKLCKIFIENTPKSFKIWKTTTFPIKDINIHETTSRIGNLCTFSCPTCDSTDFSSWCQLKSHYKTVHHVRVKYKQFLVSVAIYHACLICPKAVLCDRTLLFWHLSSAHKITLKKYEQTYQRHGGEILPKFTDWLSARLDANT